VKRDFHGVPGYAGVSKILLDWDEKTSVRVVASLAARLIAKGFQFFEHFKKLEFPFITHVSEDGSVGPREVMTGSRTPNSQ
jgi:hypothetical protein